MRFGVPAKAAADSRRVLTWNMADGKRDVQARLAANGYQDPDLKEGLEETSGCVSLGPSHLRAVSLSAPKNGTFGVWKCGIPPCKGITSIATYIFALPSSRIRKRPSAFGSCALLRMV